MARSRDTGFSPELLALPFLMAALSLAMWCSLPRRGEVIVARGAVIDERLARIRGFNALLERRGPGGFGACAPGFSPTPTVSRDAAATNTVVLGARDLRELRIPARLTQELDLISLQRLKFILQQRVDLGDNAGKFGKRMGRERIAREIDGPLDSSYAVLYASRFTQRLTRVGAGPFEGGVLVSAALFDLKGNRPLCEFAFEERLLADYPLRGDSIQGAYSRLFEQANERLAAELRALGRR